MMLFIGKIFIKLSYWFHLSNSQKEYIKTFAEVVVTNQYKAFQYIKKDSVVVDVGAFVGMFTLLASFLGKEVYAFEPNPHNFKRLLWFAGWRKNVHLYNAGLGDTREIKDFVAQESSAASAFADSGSEYLEANCPAIKAEVLTLDELNLKPNFIKMDCEGYEGRVIDGGRRTIDTYKPIIVMSAYHHANDKEELPKKLPNYDYSLQSEGQFEKDFTFIPKTHNQKM